MPKLNKIAKSVWVKVPCWGRIAGSRRFSRAVTHLNWDLSACRDRFGSTWE